MRCSCDFWHALFNHSTTLANVERASAASSIYASTTVSPSNDYGAAPAVKSQYGAAPHQSRYSAVDVGAGVKASDYAAAFVDQNELDKMNIEMTSARH